MRLGCWGLRTPRITSAPPTCGTGPPSPSPNCEGRKSFSGKDLKENRWREMWFLPPCQP